MKFQNNCSKLGICKYLFVIIGFLFITDITIIVDFPFFRQFYSFVYFTLVPGLLLSLLLKLDRISFIKKMLISVGLSISFLYFIGLFTNYLLKLIQIPKPLSTFPLLISLNISLFILISTVYFLRKDDNITENILFPQHSLRSIVKNKELTILSIFSIQFPLMSIIGRYFMLFSGNNFILITMIFLIICYIILLSYLNFYKSDVVNINFLCPFSLWMISISLLLMHGLTSNYVLGTDIIQEFYGFRVSMSSWSWDLSILDYPNEYYAQVLALCLPNSLLSVLYQSLSGINPQYVFKLYFQLIFSIVPVGVYVIFKKYIDSFNSFLSAFFFMAQTSFLYHMVDHIRTEIALLFFTLSIIVFFENKTNLTTKKILLIIFIFSTTISHYTVSYLFFFLLASLWIVVSAKGRSIMFSKATIILFFCFIFFWYGMLSIDYEITSVINHTGVIFQNLLNFFVNDVRSESTQLVYKGSNNLPTIITVIIYDLSFGFIFLGVFEIIYNWVLNKKVKFGHFYDLLIVLCFFVAALSFVLPYVSLGYGPERLYQQMLVIMAPSFVFGGYYLAKIIKLPRMGSIFVISLLIFQFLAGTYMIYQICGDHHSEDLNTDGLRYDAYFIHDEEMLSVGWLDKYANKNTEIHVDRFGYKVFEVGYDINNYNFSNDLLQTNKSLNDGYIFLRTANIKEGFFGWDNSTINYAQKFFTENLIYNNEGSKIYC